MSLKNVSILNRYKIWRITLAFSLMISINVFHNNSNAESAQSVVPNDRVMIGSLILENMILCEQYYALAMNAHRRDPRLKNQMGELIIAYDLMANYSNKGYKSIGLSRTELGKRRTELGNGLLKEIDRSTRNIGKLVDRYHKQCERIKTWMQGKKSE